jgi:hypothetical protein
MNDHMREKALEEFPNLNKLEITEVNQIIYPINSILLLSIFSVRFTMDSSIK